MAVSSYTRSRNLPPFNNSFLTYSRYSLGTILGITKYWKRPEAAFQANYFCRKKRMFRQDNRQYRRLRRRGIQGKRIRHCRTRSESNDRRKVLWLRFTPTNNAGTEQSFSSRFSPTIRLGVTPQDESIHADSDLKYSWPRATWDYRQIAVGDEDAF